MNGATAVREGLVKVGEVVHSRAVYSRINLYGGLAAIPTVLVPIILLQHGILTGVSLDLFRLLLPGLVLILPLHEAIHWLAAMAVGVPSRECRFGIYWPALMPYFRTLSPVPAPRYRLILLAPGGGMFLILLSPALLTLNYALLILAWMSLVSSAGDLYGFWRLRRVSDGQWVRDRGDLIGLEILEPHS